MQRRLALIGSQGMLASAVLGCAGEDWEVSALDLPGFDLTEPGLVRSVLEEFAPVVIVNCAAYTNVDGAETETALAMRVNGDGPGHLALVARRLGAVLVHISTDYVFDGTQQRPYREDDPVAPISAYGRSKLAGERAILASGLERYFIMRTSWLYGPNGRNFVETIVRLAKEREELRIVADQVGSPTYTADLAKAIFRLLAVAGDGRYGIYHYANAGQCSWYEFAVEIVDLLQRRGVPLKVRRVVPISTAEYPLPAPRPPYSVFSRDKLAAATGLTIPGWRESLAEYLALRTD